MSDTESYVFVDGEPASAYAVTDRAYAFGDGLFETLRFRQGSLPFWHWHQQRLERGLVVLGIDAERTVIEDGLRQALLAAESKGLASGVIKLIVSRGKSLRGYGYPSSIRPVITVSVFPDQGASAFNRLAVDDLPLVDYQLSTQPVLAGIKHLNRLDNVLAKQACQRLGCADGLVTDQQGFLIEATSSNIFILTDSGWLTPELDVTGVAGVIRQLLLEQLMPDLGLDGQQGKFMATDMAQIKAAFLTNAVAGIQPVQRLCGRQLRQDRVIEQLQASLSALFDQLPAGALRA